MSLPPNEEVGFNSAQQLVEELTPLYYSKFNYDIHLENVNYLKENGWSSKRIYSSNNSLYILWYYHEDTSHYNCYLSLATLDKKTLEIIDEGKEAKKLTSYEINLSDSIYQCWGFKNKGMVIIETGCNNLEILTKCGKCSRFIVDDDVYYYNIRRTNYSKIKDLGLHYFHQLFVCFFCMDEMTKLLVKPLPKLVNYLNTISIFQGALFNGINIFLHL
jgi:hypothetical protein